MKSSKSSWGGHPSPSQSPSHAVPPLFAKAWGLGSLFSVWASPFERVATFDVSWFHVVFFPSWFWSLDLWRKHGIAMDWCLGRMKSSVSSRGGHPIPSRSSSLVVPPFLQRHRVGEACSLFESPLVIRTNFISLFISCCFLPFFLLAPSFIEKRWYCCGLVFRKDEKQCDFPRWPP